MNLNKTNSSHFIYDWVYNLLTGWNIPENSAHYLSAFVLILAFVALLLALQMLIRKVLLRFVTRLSEKSENQLDDHLIRNNALRNFARLVPVYISYQLIPVVFAHFPQWMPLAEKFLNIVLIISWVLAIRSVFRAIRDYLKTKDSFEGKPLDSYLQVANIFLFFISAVLIFTIFTGKSPWAFLTAMGAASAVLMLVFKDTILGFVASIQVSTNDMVRVGDWIEMPKYGADGDVIEINLNTVKVQNWDKTITTIPTYYLITDSFKNWRGMQAAGGRRIKRAINIKISSIHYLKREEIDELKKIKLLVSYINQRQAEIDKYNEENFPDRSMPINGRNMTNIGMFRQYINLYVQNNPKIRQDMSILIRQLSPTEHGIPIELYMFTADIRWSVYEDIMSDIFDHLLAAIKYFNLEVFEAPASDDIRYLKSDLNEFEKCKDNKER